VRFPDLSDILGQHFQPKNFATKALLLRGIREAVLDVEEVKMKNFLCLLIKFVFGIFGAVNGRAQGIN
jgi:hypothetical protein